LYFETTPSSVFFTRPNSKVLSKCVDNALYMRGMPFLSVNKRTFGVPGLSSIKVSKLFELISTTLDPINLPASFLILSISSVGSS